MLHFEWTMKALLAGKHVLNEKPSADTAEETRQMFDLAEQKGLILLDAYHYRYEIFYFTTGISSSKQKIDLYGL
jgi:predicted dehydrogenase